LPADADDPEDSARKLQLVIQANRHAHLLGNIHLAAVEKAKEAKKRYEAAAASLHVLIYGFGEEMPLFDKPAEAKPRGPIGDDWLSPDSENDPDE
jgi:hypothetical protein